MHCPHLSYLTARQALGQQNQNGGRAANTQQQRSQPVWSDLIDAARAADQPGVWRGEHGDDHGGERGGEHAGRRGVAAAEELSFLNATYYFLRTAHY